MNLVRIGVDLFCAGTILFLANRFSFKNIGDMSLKNNRRLAIGGVICIIVSLGLIGFHYYPF